MKYFFLFVFATLILNAEYEVKKINSKKTYSLTYGSGKIVAGAEDGLYYTDTNTTTVFVRNANFQEKKVTMVRFVNNIFFAGVVDIININSGLPLQCNLSVGKEFSRLYSSNNLSDWNLKFNGTFGECSQYHFSDIAFFGNNYFFSLRLTKESTGGNIYKHDGNNLDTKPCREGNFLIDYYEFYDIEIHNDKLYFAAQPYKDNLQDNSTDGSIMTQENCNWTGNLGIEYSIYSLESFQGNLFAGGKDSNGEGVIFKTDGVNPQKNGSGWENVLTQSFFNPVKAIESTDSLLFVGLEDGAILLSKNLGQTYNLKKYNEFSGAINEMLFVKEVNYLYIAADYGLFYIDLNNVPKYKISGTVTDCDTKSDLSGVKVELKDNDNKNYKC